MSSILLWVVDGKHDAFSEQYTQARNAQGYSDADRIREVIDMVASGEVAPQQGKVMIDGLKWTAERNASKAFGPKQEVTAIVSDVKSLADFYAQSK